MSEPAPPVNTTPATQEKETKTPHTKRHSHRRGHHTATDEPPHKVKDNKKNKKKSEDEEEDNDNQKQEEEHGIAEELSGDACHNMEIGDACCALFCPCMTYGQILDSLDPNIIINRKNDKQMCHVSTGCLIWSGLMGLTIGGIQSVLSIPGLAGWMPTMYFGDILDARELFLGCAYLLPQCLCHCPLRASIAGKGKKGENVFCSCLISSFCCCCSLSSLKAWGHENKGKYSEDSVCMGKCCPCCGVLTPSSNGADEETTDNNDNSVEEEEEEEEEEAPKTKSYFYSRSIPPTSMYFYPNNDGVRFTSSRVPLLPQHSAMLNSMTSRNGAPQSIFYL
jgi:hypothetical protein